MSDDDELLLRPRQGHLALLGDDLKSDAVAIEELENGIKALEKRVAELEAKLIGIGEVFGRANARSKAMREAPMTLHRAPAANTDPAA
jgi:hypothetical protein